MTEEGSSGQPIQNSFRFAEETAHQCIVCGIIIMNADVCQIPQGFVYQQTKNSRGVHGYIDIRMLDDHPNQASTKKERSRKFHHPLHDW